MNHTLRSAAKPQPKLWNPRTRLAPTVTPVADRFLMLVRGSRRGMVLRQHQVEYGVLGLFGILALVLVVSSSATASVAQFFHQDGAREVGAHLLRLFLLANVLVQMLRWQQRLVGRAIRPEATPGLHLVAFDVTLDGRRYGQRFDALVNVAENAGAPRP